MLQIKDKAGFKKEVLDETEKAVLVDFYADWCGPCRVLAPIIEAVEKANKDVKVAKVNVDENQELAAEYNVMSIPTVYIFKKGKPFKQFVGVQSEKALSDALKA